MNPRLRALLATSRIANVPSVICSVWLTMLIFGDGPKNEQFYRYYLVGLVAVCLYIGGNFLNDWMDVAWDQEHRPERAIPSGLFSRITYLLIAIGLFFTAYSLLWLEDSFAKVVCLLITILVVIYTLIHKKTSLAIWVMGSCRACLYLLGYVAVAGLSWDIDEIVLRINAEVIMRVLWPMFGMFCYIAGISLLARYESRNVLDRKTKLIAVLLLFSPLLTHTCGVFYSAFNGFFEPLQFAGAILFGLWTWAAIRRENISIGKRVSLLLAGIALVDGVMSMNFAFNQSAITYLDITWQYMPFIAFFLALLLQKIAPAT